MNVRIWLTVIFMLISSASFAHSHKSDSVHIMKAWARTSAPGAPSAGFMMVSNPTNKDDVLLSVTGDFAKKLEIHESRQEDGVMRMLHQKEGVLIPAGGSVLFKPGSFHLMFMGLKKNFELGETYTVELEFKNAGAIVVELPVMEHQSTTMNH